MESLYYELRKRGVYAYGRYNVLLIAPPLTIGKEQLILGLAAIGEALEAIESEWLDLDRDVTAARN